tara:strand:- start:35 stop:1633 length:1599 start_codon:yes stop_codon:yes gene_type:complete
MKKVIYGPPGTGKTHELINVVKEYLIKGVHPSEIAYISFTKRAAKEALTRALKKFSDFDGRTYEKEHFKNFQTLHALAYHNVPELLNNTMQDIDYAEFGSMLPLNLDEGEYESPFSEDGTFKSSKNKYLDFVNLAVIKKKDVSELFDTEMPYKLKKDIAVLVSQELKRYKEEKYLFDYNDFLIQFSLLEEVPSFKVLIIDEAQDLSLIQWDAVDRLIEKAENVYVAGDDDQAIYEWAGAAAEKFLQLEKREGWENKTLSRSFRVPQELHKLAQQIISNIPNNLRKMKEYSPNDEEGVIYKNIPSIEHINIDSIRNIIKKGETILVLATTNKIAAEGSSFFRKNNIPYSSPTTKEASKDKINAIIAWEKFRKDDVKMSGKDIKQIYVFLGKNVAHGFKKGKKSPDDLQMYTFKDCQKTFGLLAAEDETWIEAFTNMQDRDVSYFRGILASGRKLTDEAPCRVSTISSIKGAEADHVILFPDLSWGEHINYQKANKGYETDRKFYVAVTRAKKSLLILEPKKLETRYPSLWHVH